MLAAEAAMPPPLRSKFGLGRGLGLAEPGRLLGADDWDPEMEGSCEELGSSAAPLSASATEALRRLLEPSILRSEPPGESSDFLERPGVPGLLPGSLPAALSAALPPTLPPALLAWLPEALPTAALTSTGADAAAVVIEGAASPHSSGRAIDSCMPSGVASAPVEVGMTGAAVSAGGITAAPPPTCSSMADGVTDAS